LSDIKTKWIEALRSGRYAQTKGYLRTIDQEGNSCYCAAGVLADIIDPGAWEEASPCSDLRSTTKYRWNGHMFGLQKEEYEPFEIPFSILDGAMRRNDDKFESFSDIADYLEEALGEVQ
jgi:hypothetical protein